ncbi:hypothetical protein [Marinobacter zhejiangensis]|uniref:Di-and tricarboxylate transporter n=1 Tax=Marinobacter zhejiangensis TaxID=488535 RepID=A0A1I4M4P1_9GAMM|nr:hypothetical protein [Marinobacter zhejiangensis]SFL98212.1 hypothetical protein SAMN04487963_0850 [Marinobacter zhejiangensis]
MIRYLLPLAVVLELVTLCTGETKFSVVSGCVLLVYFLATLTAMQRYTRWLVIITLLVSVGLLAAGRLGSAELLDAASSAAFYAAFLGSLGTMQCLVRRFEVLRRIHDVLLGGPPVLLYPKYAVTSCLVASVLSFGMMNLLCGSLSQTLSQRGITGQARLGWIRSVLISVLRGFALVPLVAPTSVAVAIITREMPSLTWSQLLPYGLVAALLMVVVGWVLEHRRFRLVSEQRVNLSGWPPGSGLLCLVVVAVLVVMGMLVATTPLNVSRAAMLAVPLVTLLVMLWQDRSPRSVLDEAADNVNAMANEMAIFAASAAFGVVLIAQVPEGLVSLVTGYDISPYLLAVAGLLLLPLLAALGVIPITTLSVIAGLLPPLAAMGMNPLLLAVGLVIGFALAMMLSPFGPSVMLLSRFGQVSRWLVAFGWNGLFVLILLPLLVALLGGWYWLM